jgi:hypothetical protein
MRPEGNLLALLILILYRAAGSLAFNSVWPVTLRFLVRIPSRLGEKTVFLLSNTHKTNCSCKSLRIIGRLFTSLHCLGFRVELIRRCLSLYLVWPLGHPYVNHPSLATPHIFTIHITHVVLSEIIKQPLTCSITSALSLTLNFSHFFLYFSLSVYLPLVSLSCYFSFSSLLLSSHTHSHSDSHTQHMRNVPLFGVNSHLCCSSVNELV